MSNLRDDDATTSFETLGTAQPTIENRSAGKSLKPGLLNRHSAARPEAADRGAAGVCRSAAACPSAQPRRISRKVVGRIKGRARASVLIGSIIVALVLVLAFLSLVWIPFNPVLADPAIRLQPPSATHWFGTDRLGRDVLSQLMAGSRVALTVGTMVVLIGALFGVPLGMLAAFRAGWLGGLLARGFDLMMAIPGLLLAIIFAAAFGASTWAAATALGISAIPAFARIARAGTLSVLSSEYVTASRTFGAENKHIALTHVLPNIAGSLIVHASVAFGLAILAEAGLSYLGLGTPPPTPSWGRMLQDSQSFLGTHLNLVLAPGLAIALTVLGFNLLGDGLRDALDPKLRYKR